MRFLALGDSYTIGEGVGEAARWPVRLTALLREDGLALDDPLIVATTGWTTDELSAALDAEDPAGPFDLVSLLIGVNDQYRGRPVGQFLAEFDALLARAIGYAGGRPERVLVLSIPDWGVTPFAAGRDVAAVAAAIDGFNAAARQATGRAGARWVDVTAASRAAPDLVVDDRLHPAPPMYDSWARLALPAARRALGGTVD